MVEPERKLDARSSSSWSQQQFDVLQGLDQQAFALSQMRRRESMSRKLWDSPISHGEDCASCPHVVPSWLQGL